MSTGRTLLLVFVFLLALVILVVWQAVYRARQLEVTRALQAEREAQRAALAQAEIKRPDSLATLDDQLQATRSQLLQTRAELVSARKQLIETAARVTALEQQVQTFSPQSRNERLPRRVALTDDGTGFASDSPTGAARGRPWGEEQAAGSPDTHQSGDISTAWASRLPDAGEEWLKLDYSNTVWLAEVRVRETYNPGAISKVAAVLPNGTEVTLWEGVAEPIQAPTDTSFPVPAGVQAASVKVYLDTRRVRGWNEIDAVELIGRDGSRQWAVQASASSSYADAR